MEINERLNLWQQLAASQVRQRKVKFIFCPNCQRYCWGEILDGHRYQCLECGCLVEEQNAGTAGEAGRQSSKADSGFEEGGHPENHHRKGVTNCGWGLPDKIAADWQPQPIARRVFDLDGEQAE